MNIAMSLISRERIELGRELETKVKMDDDESDEDKAAADADVEGIREPGSSEEERDVLEKSLQEEEENDNQENPWLRRTFFEEVKPQAATPVKTGQSSAVVQTEERSSNAKVLVVPVRASDTRSRSSCTLFLYLIPKFEVGHDSFFRRTSKRNLRLNLRSNPER